MYSAETAPLVQNGSSAQLEDIALGECSTPFEVVENGRMDSDEFLKTSHAADALHGAYPSSDCQTEILYAVVEPKTTCLQIATPEVVRSSPVGRETIGDQHLWDDHPERLVADTAC